MNNKIVIADTGKINKYSDTDVEHLFKEYQIIKHEITI